MGDQDFTVRIDGAAPIELTAEYAEQAAAEACADLHSLDQPPDRRRGRLHREDEMTRRCEMGHVIDSGNACCQDAIHSEQPMTPRQCASCVHRHHPHTICSGRSGGTGYRCGCVCSEARSR